MMMMMMMMMMMNQRCDEYLAGNTTKVFYYFNILLLLTRLPLTCVDTLQRHGDEQHLAINDRIGLLLKRHTTIALINMRRSYSAICCDALAAQIEQGQVLITNVQLMN